MEFWTILVRDMEGDRFVRSLSNETRVKVITEAHDHHVLEFVAPYLSGSEGELVSVHKINTRNNKCTPYEVTLKANKLTLQPIAMEA